MNIRASVLAKLKQFRKKVFLQQMSRFDESSKVSKGDINLLVKEFNQMASPYAPSLTLHSFRGKKLKNWYHELITKISQLRTCINQLSFEERKKKREKSKTETFNSKGKKKSKVLEKLEKSVSELEVKVIESLSPDRKQLEKPRPKRLSSREEKTAVFGTYRRRIELFLDTFFEKITQANSDERVIEKLSKEIRIVNACIEKLNAGDYVEIDFVDREKSFVDRENERMNESLYFDMSDRLGGVGSFSSNVVGMKRNENEEGTEKLSSPLKLVDDIMRDLFPTHAANTEKSSFYIPPDRSRVSVHSRPSTFVFSDTIDNSELFRGNETSFDIDREVIDCLEKIDNFSPKKGVKKRKKSTQQKRKGDHGKRRLKKSVNFNLSSVYSGKKHRMRVSKNFSKFQQKQRERIRKNLSELDLAQRKILHQNIERQLFRSVLMPSVSQITAFDEEEEIMKREKLMESRKRAKERATMAMHRKREMEKEEIRRKEEKKNEIWRKRDERVLQFINRSNIKKRKDIRNYCEKISTPSHRRAVPEPSIM